MRNDVRALALWTILASFATGATAADQGEEIIVTIPAPPAMVDLPSGMKCAKLSAEDVEQAKLQVRKAYQEAKAKDIEMPIVGQLPGGLFLLTDPVTLGPEDGGDAQRPIIWRGSERGAGTVLSGGALLSDWKEIRPGVVQTTLPEVAAGTWRFRTLWTLGAGKHPARCRMPKEGYFRLEKTGADRRTHFIWQEGDLKPYEDLTNVELIFIHDWSITRCPVLSLDPNTRTLRVPRQIGCALDFFTIDHWEAQPRYFLENSLEFLTEPGEWHLDRKTGELTYNLRDGETAGSLVLIAPTLENTLDLVGTADHPVRHLHFEKIGFRHTGPKAENEDTYWGIQATWHHEPRRGSGEVMSVPPFRGAVSTTYAENCHFDHLAVQDVAATGVSIGRGSVACTLQNSRVANCGGNGIMVGSADQDDPARSNTIDRCDVAHAGQLFYGAVGIWIGFTQETTVSHSTIRDMPYTGVSCGWLWSPEPTVARGQRIVANDIGRCMQILSDGGGIYTLGFQPDSILAENHIHDIPLNAGRAESNGMFLDEGTKGFTIENNFIHGTDMSPLRFHRADQNIVRQNYLIVPNDDVPMIRYNNTPESNITLIDNVTQVDDLDAALKNWQQTARHSHD